MAAHSSTLPWKIPWTEEPGGLQLMGSRRVGHDWATSLSLFTFMHWRRKWQPTPVFLPGESQGRRSLVGCRLWGRRVRHDWSDLAAEGHWRVHMNIQQHFLKKTKNIVQRNKYGRFADRPSSRARNFTSRNSADRHGQAHTSPVTMTNSHERSEEHTSELQSR